MVDASGSSLGGLSAGVFFVVRERECITTPLTTDETPTQSWQRLQEQRLLIEQAPAAVEQPRKWAVGDDSSLTMSTEDAVVSGPWEPGMILHACPLTK